MTRGNLVGEALDGLGRRYVAVPPIVMVAFLAALFFVTGAGQARLQAAGERMQQSAGREHAVDDLQTSLARAVAAERGYLVTGDQRYLALYDAASADIEPRLERVHAEYAGFEPTAGDVQQLQVLTGKRLADLTMVLALQRKQGAAAAIALINTNVGLDTGQSIGKVLDTLRAREAGERVAAGAHWSASLRLNRWITIAGTLISILLVGVASRLVYSDLRRRQGLTAELRDQKQQLEREVEERTHALAELSTHLQGAAEREKAELARELHDELGGLLVGARMDLSWAEKHLIHDNPDLQARLHRVQQNLAAGVDLKRRLIEELRPTLLDNVGLYAALRWQLKETCGKAGLTCIETYPDNEPLLNADAAIAIFRIAQEGFVNIPKHAGATTVNLSIALQHDTLTMRIEDDGIGMAMGKGADGLATVGSHGLASMRHRVRALRGQLEVSSPTTGGTLLLIRIPTAGAVAQSST